MEFSPFNNVVKLCLQGMEMEDKYKSEKALKTFLKAWDEATNDFEKFLAAYYVARLQKNPAEKLKWLDGALQFALNINNDAANSALPLLYSNIAKCFEDLGNSDKANQYSELAISYKNNPSDKGPFYHGTKADLKPGDLLSAGGNSNYKSELKMNHIYFTALINGAGLAAALAKGDGSERVYIVVPTGSFENDPNVTDKKFPGNPTRSYRSAAPLKIVVEITDWVRPSTEQLQKFQEKLDNSKGEIIN
jgi:DNA/RNA tunnel of bacterial DNA dependent RNA polymerase.